MKDLIERRDVLNLFDSVSQYMGNWLIQYIEDGISSITSAQPERRKGKWVPLICTSDEKHHEWCGYQCSICGERTPRLMQYNFCPNCGADMRGEQDE